MTVEIWRNKLRISEREDRLLREDADTEVAELETLARRRKSVQIPLSCMDSRWCT
jgi:hypothetical protein